MQFLKNYSFTLSLLAAAIVLHGTGCGGGGPKSAAGSTTPSPSSPPSSPTTTPSPSQTPGSAITITSPASGASVGAPFNLSASAATCSSQPVSSMGYSFDDSADTTVVNGAQVNTQVSAETGAHTLNVKAWGNAGAACNASVAVNVTDSSSAASSPVPANATTVSAVQALGGWQATHDTGTPGSSSGSMSVVGSPSMSGSARQFVTSFSGSGGELYNANVGNDTTATNFFYDAWVYLTSSASTIQNLEMDMNQVMANGETVLYGFQCDGNSGTWDYTKNVGTPTQPNDQWEHSSAPCNMRNWSQNTWHHVQVSYSRDGAGNVTYHSVWLDGAESEINATAPSAFALGWAPALQTNFQVDGLGSGTNTVYLDQLSISRW
ncbi:MAG TPA: hypothetical protein VGF96_05690 [Terracidiphilus sp.]